MNPPSLSLHGSFGVNLAGHSAGAVVFGNFLYLLIQNRKIEGPPGWWSALGAASLALFWNLGSLGVLVGASLLWSGAEWLATPTLCCLSALPSVLLRLSLAGTLKPVYVAGYVLSSVAIVVHLESLILIRPVDRSRALLVITIGFGVLTVVSAVAFLVRALDRSAGSFSRIVGPMALFLFAMSFVHLENNHPMQAWSRELAVHHCGIPLAVLVLLRDYRFVLIDAFVRFLANCLLAAVLSLLLVRAAVTWGVLSLAGEAIQVSLITVLSTSLIAFAILRSLVQRWLTRGVFRRPSLDGMRQKLQFLSLQSSDEWEFLRVSCEETAKFIKAERSLIQRLSDKSNYPRWVEQTHSLQFHQGDGCVLLFARRQGGRRYLSEDLAAISYIGNFIVEEVVRIREAEVQRLVSGAELRALQSQINPHFLFNSLNALYGLIPRESRVARSTVLNLSTLFRYLLQSPQTFVRVSDELQIVEAYLEIEKLRLGQRLRVETETATESLGCRIPRLSIQPLIENAVKHGIAASSNPGLIQMRISRGSSRLVVAVRNTCPPVSNLNQQPGAGIGLENVRRRLGLCFSSGASFDFERRDDYAEACFSVPASWPDPVQATAHEVVVKP